MKKSFQINCFILATVLLSSPSLMAENKSSDTEIPEASDVRKNKTVDTRFQSLLSTAYMFRGENVFMRSKHDEFKGVFSPSVEVLFSPIGLSTSYSAYFQTNGDNKAFNTNTGVGHKQDFRLFWSKNLWQYSELSTGMGYYFYPFADKFYTGTKLPSYLDFFGQFIFGTSRNLKASLFLAYLKDLNGQTTDMSYLYINPWLKKHFNLTNKANLSFGISAGFRLYAETYNTLRNNTFNVSLTNGFSILVTEEFKLSPSIHLSWSNLADIQIANETAIWVCLKTEFLKR